MIRFASFAAVSTIEQVDGVSLDNQIEKCKERGKSEGWVDTNLQYIADGYSRTGYVNLSDAETDIPPLATCLADMRAGKYDVLLVWNYDRLGDLIVMVATEFRNNKKQLFSLSQPTPIQENYNPYMDDTSFIMQSFAPIWQRQRIADLRRKWEAGMPKRVKDGLHPNRAPFGYRKDVEKNKPHILIPAEASLIRDMARLLLEGKSLKAIMRYCSESGIKSRRGTDWSHSTISRILENPYYTGFVYWHKTQRVMGKSVALPLSRRLIARGQHEPIFTQTEHDKILTELKMRQERNQRIQVRFPLSGLTYCGICGGKLNRGRPGRSRRSILKEHDRSCKTYRYADIFPKIAEEIQRSSLERRNPKEAETQKTDYTFEIKGIEERIERVQQSAELGVFTPTQAAKRVTELQRSLDDIYRRKMEAEQVSQAQSELDELEDMAEWIQNDDPAAVNQLLHSVIARIVLLPDKITIEWR